MGHSCGRGRAMPVLYARWNPRDVARADFLDFALPMLDETDTSRDDQRLAKRMRVPGGACAGLKGDRPSADGGGRGCGETGIDPGRLL